MHGCDAINPHNIDHFKKEKIKDINWTPSIKHWFYRVLPFYYFLCFFSFWAVSSCSEGVWPLKSCKKLCTEMCVTVYYLNVSGLQSDRHSYNKENMFWTACFCLWLQCVNIFWGKKTKPWQTWYWNKKKNLLRPHPPESCVKNTEFRWTTAPPPPKKATGL